MTSDRSDCMGEGDFYGLKQSTASTTDLRTENDADERSIFQDVVPGDDTRIDADTGEPYSLRALSLDLSNQDWYVRIRAAWALGRTGDVEAILPLVKALDDEHKEVRDRAYEALKSLNKHEEPLPVRILLCQTVDDTLRTEMLVALTSSRGARGAFDGFGSVKAYCEHWLEEASDRMNTDEIAVLNNLKRSAAGVLASLQNRNDSEVLLRAGDTQDNQKLLLRASTVRHHSDDPERLLRPSSHESAAVEANYDDSGKR